MTEVKDAPKPQTDNGKNQGQTKDIVARQPGAPTCRA